MPQKKTVVVAMNGEIHVHFGVCEEEMQRRLSEIIKQHRRHIPALSSIIEHRYGIGTR